MILFPNAKINIGLNVVERRDDGFHNIETIFYPVQITDSLEIIQSDCLSFKNFGLQIDAPIESNLCIKAYNHIKQDFEIPAVGIFLQKNIPFGAGLGGGSSDASFTIRLLNELFRLDLSSEQMKEYAKKIGSDCAFFIENKPIYAFEKGDAFENVNVSLKGKYIVLVKPNITVSTAEAYSGIEPLPSSFDLRDIASYAITDWRNYVKNDFEESVFRTYPELAKIKEELYDLGAEYAAMSGSGSTIFGIFNTTVDIQGKWDGCYVKQLVLE